MSDAVSTLQDFPWEESIQAVKDSLRFDSYPAFAEHVFNTLAQNSPETCRWRSSPADHRSLELLPRSPFRAHMDSRPFTQALRGGRFRVWRLREVAEARRGFGRIWELNQRSNPGVRGLLNNLSEGLSLGESVA